jgi:putative chitinase
MISITTDQLKQLAPNARAEYLATFADADTVLARYGINANGLRVAHFMAQVLHESGALTILTESMNYRADALLSIFGTKRISSDQAQKFGRTTDHPADQRSIANIVYGGDWGKQNLGNIDPDDGWNFRGTGLIQMTGRGSRLEIGKKLQADFVNTPEAASDPRYLLEIACAEWDMKGCNTFADRDDVVRVTKLINGGNIGLEERKVWLVKTKAMWLNAPPASMGADAQLNA